MSRFGPFVEPLAFALYIGAAMEAGDPMQRVRVKARVLPLLPQYRADGDERLIRAVIRDVLGAEWVPTGEWQAWIDKLSAP